MRRILLLIATAALAGCVTHNVPVEKAAGVPAERIKDTTYTTARDSGQKIVVVRNSGAYVGSVFDLTLSVDGKDTAEMSTGEVLPLYLPEGQHLLTAKMPMSAPQTVLVTVPSRFTVFRYDIDGSGPRFQPATE